MGETAAVLLVEDDDGIARPLAAALEAVGYTVVRVATGREALQSAVRADAVILDLGLPDVDGVEVCRRLRGSHPDLPILVLTARTGETDVVVGLDAGADDYVTKPFRLAELQARLRALLRRTAADRTGGPVAAGDVNVDPAARRAWLGDAELDLTPREFDLLHALVARAGTAVSRSELTREVWGEQWYGSNKNLDVHISSLRRKLGDDPEHPTHLATVRGIGYRFEHGSAP